MTDSKDWPVGKQGLDFRWGIPLLDNQPGFAKVYEFMLDHYAAAVTRDEFLCIIHLARYHYNSEKGESRPALETIAKQMGYAHKNSVHRLVKSLEDKGMLTVTRRPGFTSIYSAGPFTKYMMVLAGITPEGVTLEGEGGITPQCEGRDTPQCEGVSHPSVPEEEKDKEDKKRRQQQKEKEKTVVKSSQSSSLTPEQAAAYQEQYKDLTKKIKNEREQASYAALAAAGVSETAALRIAQKVNYARVLQVCLAAEKKEGIEDKPAWIVKALNDGWAIRIPSDDTKPRTDLDRAIVAGEYRVKNRRTGEWKAAGEL